MENQLGMDRQMQKVRIEDSFWSRYVGLVRDTVLPYQWEILNDRIPGAEPSHVIQNFRIAAGLEEGQFYGEVFQDSDLAKWLEASAYCLETKPDPSLEAAVDEVIELIAAAQQEDGYLNTYFTIGRKEKEWGNLYECHEMYSIGHMIEAAVAHYFATGKRRLLDIMCLAADHIGRKFGPEPEKIPGYPGHQEIELALIKLYEATGAARYLELSYYFIEERGKAPNYFVKEWATTRNHCTFKTDMPTDPPDLRYNQSHEPVYEQDHAVGHAVRAMYMYSAMADLAMADFAREKDNVKLLSVCRKLWHNVVSRQMYITGAIGSTRIGEAFTFDYDLPNDLAYAETCASIGLIFWAHRMRSLEMDGSYSDVMEKALYNVVLSSISDDGKKFFYVNPMEVWPSACEKNPDRRHVRPVRQGWFGCACCPPNVARMLASLHKYIYTYEKNVVYVHLYIGSELEQKTEQGILKIRQENNYPWEGDITFRVLACPAKTAIALRIPGWCTEWEIKVNGKPVSAGVNNGYARFTVPLEDGDVIQLSLSMPVTFIQAHPQVRADAGKVAIQRGPLIYCLEEADNGENLSALAILPDADVCLKRFDQSSEPAVAIRGKARRISEDGWEDCLYRPFSRQETDVEFKAIPYFMWGNRTPGEMMVWIRST